MKKSLVIKNTYLLFFLVFAIYACQYKGESKESTDLDFFKHQYNNSILETDSAEKITRLDVINQNRIEERLVFNFKGELIEYLFFDYEPNEPRYSVTYKGRNNIINQHGDPIFITSEHFKKAVITVDSFYIQIYLATPPNCRSEFSIYEIAETGKFERLTSHVMKDNFLANFLEKVDRQKTFNKYVLISRIIDDGDAGLLRTDSTFFSFKTK